MRESERRLQCGITLIELIGVMAVVAVLAAIMAPSVLRQMDQAARTKEISDLNAISNALVLEILNTNGTKTIPSQATWAQAVAKWTQQPVTRITTNNRGCSRVFLIDTNGLFGTAAGALPYTQSINTALTAPVVNARLLIVSTIARPFVPVTSGKPGNSDFNAIWNTADGAKPSTWTTWQGKGEDLVIQRLNLDQLFHRLILVNRDELGIPPTFSIDTTNTLPVAVGNVVTACYLQGTTVGLCNPAGTPMLRFRLTRDLGYVFDGSIWHDQISGGDSSEVMAQEFADLSVKFLASQWYPGANQPGRGDQQGALTAMFNFMLIFSMWADQFPHFPRHGANANQVPEYQLLDALVGPSTGGSGSDLLNLFTGANGLLNQ
jgi:type II secretory pathway pseudopilin PulG